MEQTEYEQNPSLTYSWQLQHVVVPMGVLANVAHQAEAICFEDSRFNENNARAASALPFPDRVCTLSVLNIQLIAMNHSSVIPIKANQSYLAG